MPVPVLGVEKVEFVKATGKRLNELELHYCVTKHDAVDDLIEKTCWSDEEQSLQIFRGNRGNAEDRLQAVLKCLSEENIGAAD